MKKYKRITQELYNDDILIELLEEEARNGWKLDHVDFFYLVFESIEPTTLKYQIDYVEYTAEYGSVIESLGYKCVRSAGSRNIYVTENLDAEDLYNDYETKIISRLNYYRLSKIFGNLCIVFIGISICWKSFLELYYTFYRHSIGQFLLTTTNYIFYSFGLLITIYYTITFLNTIYKRKYFQNILKTNIEDTDKTNRILYKENYMEAINLIILPSISIAAIIYLWIYQHSIVLLLIFLCISIILTIQFFFKKNIYTKMFQAFTVIACILIGYMNLNSSIYDINQKLYYEDKVEDYFIYENKDIFTNQKMIHIFDNDYYENYVVALNSNIAQEIFKEEVIRMEYYSHFKEETDDEYNYKTYTGATLKMNKLESNHIDQGYYNDQYVVCLKDNEILSFRITEIPKEDIIHYYFE